MLSLLFTVTKSWEINHYAIHFIIRLSWWFSGSNYFCFSYFCVSQSCQIVYANLVSLRWWQISRIKQTFSSIIKVWKKLYLGAKRPLSSSICFVRTYVRLIWQLIRWSSLVFVRMQFLLLMLKCIYPHLNAVPTNFLIFLSCIFSSGQFLSPDSRSRVDVAKGSFVKIAVNHEVLKRFFAKSIKHPYQLVWFHYHYIWH